jgi:alcohol dehydrogenase (cytochrome c)
VLYTDKAGKRRVAVGSKDGFLYVLDRKTHKLVSKTPVTTIEKAKTAPTPQGVHACPGSIGGVEWNGPAYSPKAGLLYTGAVDWCATFFSGPSEYDPPKFFIGGRPRSDTSKTGWFTAVDGRTGKVAWKYHAASPVLSGATPTAGGVVFSGDGGGEFLAFDAKSGKLLLKKDLGGSLGSGVITYDVGGKQYVATTTGNISRAGLSSERDPMPRVLIMTTGLAPDAAPVKLAAASEAELKHHFGANQGKNLYGLFCTACHGVDGSAGPGGPAIREAAKRMSHDELVTWLKNPAPPMPKLAPPMTGPELDAVASYVKTLK